MRGRYPDLTSIAATFPALPLAVAPRKRLGPVGGLQSPALPSGLDRKPFSALRWPHSRSKGGGGRGGEGETGLEPRSGGLGRSRGDSAPGESSGPESLLQVAQGEPGL